MKPIDRHSAPDPADAAGRPRRPALRLVVLVLRAPVFLVAAGLLGLAAVAGSERLLVLLGLRPAAFGPGGSGPSALALAIVPLPILVGLVAWRARVRHGGGWARALGLVVPRSPGRLALALALWPPLQIGWTALLAAGSGVPLSRAWQLPPFAGTTLAAWIVWLVVLAPVAEEMLFRGDLFARARGLLGPAATVVLAAGLFALSHAERGWAQPLSVLPLGLVLGAVRLWCASLWAAILLHAASNGAVVAVMLWHARP
ncbi:type II CAAX endopeptidase family protein [uncultured Methylobacterium sp.]|uniref:CPBP family intramembrane glutamic endopeptidase n=1 Tax=uncultured Methylobacterium sp. TaxID=157278 RepID=UPI00262E42AE|nr:type II CAAX endopeptidase family protein [uncultured Methylobacterium sp.]